MGSRGAVCARTDLRRASERTSEDAFLREEISFARLFFETIARRARGTAAPRNRRRRDFFPAPGFPGVPLGGAIRRVRIFRKMSIPTVRKRDEKKRENLVLQNSQFSHLYIKRALFI